MNREKKRGPVRRLKKLLTDALIVLGVSAGLVLILEGGLRLFYPQNLSGKSIVGESFSNPDEMLGIRYTPGAKWRFDHPEYHVVYSINEDGFRDAKPHPMPKPPGVTRVLLLGDSFTFGQGVDYDQTWPVLVEKKMSAKDGTHRVDLVKAGMQGMDTRSEYLLMKELVPKYDCDVVVIAFLINDLYTNSLDGLEGGSGETTSTESDTSIASGGPKKGLLTTMKNVFIRNDKRTTFHLLTLARRWAISSASAYCRLYLMAPNRRQWLTVPLPAVPKARLKVTQTLFSRMVEYCRSRGKRLIVVSIPQQFQVLYFDASKDDPHIDVSIYDKIFGAFAESAGFVWIPTLDYFVRPEIDRDDLFYRLDGHLTAQGHALVA
ncbi:MAG: SGNH/GDSL hydrolase family protein, partial [Calditrichaeota bacterium]